MKSVRARPAKARRSGSFRFCDYFGKPRSAMANLRNSDRSVLATGAPASAISMRQAIGQDG
jgi:hypothetical protein